MIKIILILTLTTLFGCTQGDKPNQVLESYINYRFKGTKVSKEKLLEALTGTLAERVNAMSDSQINSEIFVGKYKLRKFKVLNSKCMQDKCFSTYTIKYDTYTQGKRIVSSVIKEVAELIRVSGKWKIADVSNIKTYHESEPINSCVVDQNTGKCKVKP